MFFVYSNSNIKTRMCFIVWWLNVYGSGLKYKRTEVFYKYLNTFTSIYICISNTSIVQVFVFCIS